MRVWLLVAMLLGVSSSALAQEPDVHISPPVRRKHVDPEYPKSQLESGKDVEVILTVTLDAEGKIEKTEVKVSGGKEFDDAALAALAQWEFAPATRDDKPVHSKINVTFHFAPPQPAGPKATSTIPSQVAEEEKHPIPPPAPEPDTVTVFGRSHIPSRGVGDTDIHVGNLRNVPRQDAAGLLRLAPSVALQNEGGTGHPYQIYLRGFDAREGQDIEFTVDGIPINEVGNVHGSGLVDSHFIIPEVVRNLRVIQGPFAPQQGNFAVAGSALYDLGLENTGLTTKITGGSFGTRRMLLMWRPGGCSERTFAAGELFASDGFGQNRSSERASAIGGYEGRIGASLVWRVLAQSYATHYQQAGVVREDDVNAGRIGFYDTYDRSQSGDSARHSIGLTLADKLGNVRFRQQVFGIARDFRLRENFTGFIGDAQELWQSPHPQRGDLVDQQSRAFTVGARGSARLAERVIGHNQELELGYYARYDAVDGLQQRDRFGTTVPYRRDLDLSSNLSNIGLYVDASLKPVSWITVRGGLRGDLFHNHIHDKCALTSPASLMGTAADTQCFTVDRTGPRNADQSTSNAATAWQPRGTLMFGPFQSITFTMAAGMGARSIDPQFVTQDVKSPFATATAYEGGASFDRTFGVVDVHARSIFFQTQVDRDLFFNQTLGRSTLANGTTRSGWSGTARITGKFFDVAANVTLTRATFDDTHLLIPYAPPFLARLDGTLFGELPIRIAGKKLVSTFGLGATYVGPRPLPLGERSTDYLTLDAAVTARWKWLEVGVTGTNLLALKYRLAEYNYVSDFGSQAYPTRVAARHFVAGEPLAIFAHMAVTFGGP